MITHLHPDYRLRTRGAIPLFCHTSSTHAQYKFTFNIRTISPTVNSSCFLLATHSSPGMFSLKTKSSFGTESDAELKVNFNKNIRL